MDEQRGHKQDTDSPDIDELRSALAPHRRVYLDLAYRAPLAGGSTRARPRAPRYVTLLAASLAAVAFVVLWPPNGSDERTPLAEERSTLPLTLRPEATRLAGVEPRFDVRAPRHDRVTRVPFRPPRRPSQRGG